jgi:hypothetical protein
VCDAGYFCKSGAAVPNDNSMLCPAGFYCEKGTTIPKKCLNGKFSAAGASSQENCTDCKPGYYCLDGSTKMNECPRGYYCDSTISKIPIPCPIGTFSNKTANESAETC